MKLICYTKRPGGMRSRLGHAIASVLPSEQVVNCSDLNKLRGWLNRADSRPETMVLAAEDHADLSELLGLADAIHDVRTVLVLPDLETETVRAALVLRPSFFTHCQGTFGDLQAVLTKLFHARKDPSLSGAGCSPGGVSPL